MRLARALPVTAGHGPSAANVQAGVKTISRVLHGVWPLLLAALLTAVPGIIAVAALAAVLAHVGFKLLPLAKQTPLWRGHRGELGDRHGDGGLHRHSVAQVKTDHFMGLVHEVRIGRQLDGFRPVRCSPNARQIRDTDDCGYTVGQMGE